MRGIESMPFRYIALALAAVLIIGFVIQFSNTTNKGLSEISGNLIEKVKSAETKQVDLSGPEIGDLKFTHYSWETCFEVNVKDDSGVSFVSVRFNGMDISLNKEGTNGGWEVWGKCVSGYYSGGTATVLAVDASPHRNYNTRVFTVG